MPNHCSFFHSFSLPFILFLKFLSLFLSIQFLPFIQEYLLSNCQVLSPRLEDVTENHIIFIPSVSLQTKISALKQGSANVGIKSPIVSKEVGHTVPVATLPW